MEPGETFGEWFLRTPAEEREAQIAAWKQAEERFQEWYRSTVCCVSCQGRGWNWAYTWNGKQIVRETCEVCGGLRRVKPRGTDGRQGAS